MTSLLIVNGPNLNLLGQRQPEVYGHTTLAEIESACVAKGSDLGVAISCVQSNHEGALIDAIHDARGKHDGIIMNAGAYTHTSVALMDAVFSVEVPTIELHLSNVHARETFRQVSYISKAVIGQISGFGPNGYALAIDALLGYLESNK